MTQNTEILFSNAKMRGPILKDTLQKISMSAAFLKNYLGIPHESFKFANAKPY